MKGTKRGDERAAKETETTEKCGHNSSVCDSGGSLAVD